MQVRRTGAPGETERLFRYPLCFMAQQPSQDALSAAMRISLLPMRFVALTASYGLHTGCGL